MEAEPRILEFTGEELARVSHAYGTNGIITELEMPLAPAYDWVEMFVAFEDFEPAVDFAEGVANDFGAYRDAPAGFRFWGGPTIDPADMAIALEWLNWAVETNKPA